MFLFSFSIFSISLEEGGWGVLTKCIIIFRGYNVYSNFRWLLCSLVISHVCIDWAYTLQLPNVKELLAPKRCDISSLSGSNEIRNQSHLVCKRNWLAKLAKWLSCVEYLSVWCVWLYVITMSRMRFRVNLHSIVAWMFETGAICQV